MGSQNIVETIGSWGVKSTSGDLYRVRCERPKPGDVIDFGGWQGTYPYTQGQYGRMTETHDGVVFCCGQGSAFLYENGQLSLSGGPFSKCSLEDLEPTYRLRRGLFWNWGDNFAGAGQGVEYLISRPVFKFVPRCREDGCNVQVSCTRGTYREWKCESHTTEEMPA